MVELLLGVIVKLRWWYFHLHPGYIKFHVTDDGRKESYFFHPKTNSIHYNFVWVDKTTVREGEEAK